MFFNSFLLHSPSHVPEGNFVQYIIFTRRGRLGWVVGWFVEFGWVDQINYQVNDYCLELVCRLRTSGVIK